jgi:hypothetical protein
MRVMIDAKKARDTKADGPRGSKSLLVFPDDSDRTAVVGRNRGDAVQIPERAAPSLG